MAGTTTKSGIGSGVRIAISLIIAICLSIFMLLWDGLFIDRYSIPGWCGPFVFLPIFAVVLGFGGNCLIQQLSCGQIQWLAQLNRASVIPIPFILFWILLYFFPGLRWPIEGLFQNSSESMSRGLSSAFYSFWIAVYTQSLLSGISQLCPK